MKYFNWAKNEIKTIFRNCDISESELEEAAIYGLAQNVEELIKIEQASFPVEQNVLHGGGDVEGELLPCPFPQCSGKAILHDWVESEKDNEYITVDCEKCGLSTRPFKNSKEATCFWNTRQKL